MTIDEIRALRWKDIVINRQTGQRWIVNGHVRGPSTSPYVSLRRGSRFAYLTAATARDWTLRLTIASQDEAAVGMLSTLPDTDWGGMSILQDGRGQVGFLHELDEPGERRFVAHTNNDEVRVIDTDIDAAFAKFTEAYRAWAGLTG